MPTLTAAEKFHNRFADKLAKAKPCTLHLLKKFSPAAFRMLNRHPNLLRFLEQKPRFKALTRLPLHDEKTYARSLRLMRQRVFIHTAFFEAQGGSPLEAAKLWSAFADAAIKAADRLIINQLRTRFLHPMNNGLEVKRVIFALGKWGSEELNASSDIDLIFAYGSDDVSFTTAADTGLKEPNSAHDFFRRWAQGIRKILHDVTDEGFVFRVDLNLRPEGNRGPLVNSIDALERYYENFGLTWERAALTRLRPVVDVGSLGSDLIHRLRPFVSPRSASPQVFSDLDEMRERIETSAKSIEPDFDVKRSQGGIRDVEFLVHSYQLLLSGRQKELRHGSIITLLSQLESEGYLSVDDANFLQDGYLFLRRTEHVLQYEADQQTQRLFADYAKRKHFSSRFFPKIAADNEEKAFILFEKHLTLHRDRIRDVYDRHIRSTAGPHQELSDTRTWTIHPHAARALFKQIPDDTRLFAMKSLGFSNPAQALEQLRSLERRPTSPFSPRTQAQIPHAARLSAFLLSEAANTAHPDATWARLLDFFSSRIHPTLVSRLADSPRLARVICRVLGLSTPLSKMLCKRSGTEAILFNGIKRDRLPKSRILRSLREGLTIDPQSQKTLVVEEEALARMRKVQGRVLLSEGMGLFAGLHDVVQTGHHLSLLADALLERAYEIAESRIIRRFGRPSDVQFSVFALGSLGGHEFGFFRDLDLIFVYDGHDDSNGNRSISCSHWAAKLAQQIIWALSIPLAEGICYEVDTRLRPSGNQGPLCVKKEAFLRYHQGASAIWERQSMLRLRPVAGDLAFGYDIKKAVQPLLYSHEYKLGAELLKMRTRMDKERAHKRGLHLKVGKGGMADIEFIAQGYLLRHQKTHKKLQITSTRRALSRLASLGMIPKEQADTLRKHYDALTAIREVAMLVEHTRQGILTEEDPRWPRLLQSRLLEPYLDLSSQKLAMASLVERMTDVKERTQFLLERL